MSNAQIPVSFWFISIFILVVIVGVVLYVTAPSDVPLNSTLNSSNVSLFRVFVSSNFPVDYSLVNTSGVVVASGLLRDGVLDSVYDVPNGSLLNLSGWGSSYYWNMSLCNVSVDDTRCSISVSRKAFDYSLVLYPDSFSVNFASGVLQSPIACFAWSFGLDNILMDFPSTPIPGVLYRRVDACYQLPDVSSSQSFRFYPRFNKLYLDVPVSLSVFVYDYEKDGFDNVGLRNSSITIQNR
jgi:hypothetical protein